MCSSDLSWAKENQIPIGTNAVEDYQITGQMVNDPEMYVTQLYIPLNGKYRPGEA